MPRFQFRLKTLFVVMTIAAVLVAAAVSVTGYVIREREGARNREIDRALGEFDEGITVGSPAVQGTAPYP
ncbi:MAG: hypothetical protein K8T91_22515 [Planctomycetes bacterium]|nr:hypothetical protein [Planctomycetota bacterium]